VQLYQNIFRTASHAVKTGFTVPLIIFAFITLLLGIAIVIVSDYLEPTKPHTQP